jgi:hypothetical protein
MKIFSKNIVLKIAVLLISVITVITLGVTATYSRYITTVDKDIGFKATKQPKILFGETEVKPNTLIPLTQWTEGVEQLNGGFNLTASGLAENEDMNFYIRVFVEKIDPADVVTDESDTTNDDPLKDLLTEYEDETQGEKLPIEMTLSLGNTVYTALESETNTESDFYSKNQKQGMCYFFYDSAETEPQPKEHIFSLNAKENVKLDFVLNAYNADKKSDRIYIYIETLK